MKKKISIVLLTLILTINFTFGRVQEAKAEVITLTTIAVASAILLAAGVVYQNRFELYKMAEEYADDLKNYSDALVQTSTGIIVGVGAFASLKNYLTNKANNPVTEATIKQAILVNGTYTYNFQVPTADEPLSQSINVPLETAKDYIISCKYIVNGIETGNYTKSFTCDQSGEIVLYGYSTGISNYTTKARQLNYHLYNRTTSKSLSLGSYTNVYAGDTVSICVDFGVPINTTEDKSISIDYSGALTGASEEKAKATIPVGSVVTPKPYDIPTDLSQPVPTVGDVVDVVPGVNTGELEMDIPNVQDTIKNKFDDPNLRNTWKAIEEMDTSRGAPPKITFDLSKLFIAATSRFNVKNPFPSKEYTLIDFGMLQDYNFGGSPLIDYFRGLVGMGFIITTFMYCWRKLTPDNVLGD